MIKSAKRDYFHSKINESKGNPKSLWKTLKLLGHFEKNKSTCKIGLKIDDEVCFNEKLVAESFNNFFTTVASDLVKKLPLPSNEFGKEQVNKFYTDKGVFKDRFKLHSVENETVLKLLRSLNVNKAVGLDGTSSRFLRDGADNISTLVTHLINLSISTSTVPYEIKRAKVVPLHKKNSKVDVGNYRPVSIFCILSKLLGPT